jgi:hypothetical protein
MPAKECFALLKALYPFHNAIFDGIDEQGFAHAMLNSHAQLNKLKVFRDDSGNVCAYCAVHRADVKIGDKAVSVFKAEIAVSRDQRGRALSKNFIAIEFLRHLLLHPFRKTYFLSAYVHPASYRMAAGTFWKLYPSWRRPTPPEMEHLMNQLADALDYAHNDERPWTRRVGWIPRGDTDVRFTIESGHDPSSSPSSVDERRIADPVFSTSCIGTPPIPR